MSYVGKLEAVDITKIYPGRVKAVDKVTLRFGKGVYSIMGPNGSGKSTTLSICAGVLKPTYGKVYVNDLELWGKDWIEARRHVGYAPQDMPFNPRISALDNLIWIGLLRNMSLMESRIVAKRLLKNVDLYEYRNRLVGKFSGGMRRRLTIASAFLHNPDIVILDEPGSGLDPKAKEEVWIYISQLTKDKTLIFSSHDAREVERFSDETYIFHKGKVVAHGRPGDLIKEYIPGKYVSIWFEKDVEPPEIDGVKPMVFGSIAWYDTEAISLDNVIKYLSSNNIPFHRIELVEPSLNEVFIRLTGEKLVG